MKTKPLPAGLLVFLGGGIGATLRAYLTILWGGAPSTIWACNLIGAYLLGALSGYLSTFPEENTGRRTLRLFLGTGACGGFTTYSTFTVNIADLLAEAAYLTVTLYFAASLVGGALCCWLGILWGSAKGAKQG